MEKLLTLQEVAELLGIRVDLVHSLIQAKRLRCLRIGHRTVRVAHSEVERYVKDWTSDSYMKPVKEAVK